MFSVQRRNWKAILSCSNLEKDISTITLLQHIKKRTKSLHTSLEPFGISCSIYTRSPQHTLYSESFLEIFEMFLFKYSTSLNQSYAVYER